jgi:transcriptional regulator with XRE-family HTH domain
MVRPAMIRPGEPGRRSRPLLRAMIGEVLRRTRLEQRRSLSDVSRAARVSMPYLSEVERGRKEASSEILAAICDALHLSLSDLLAGVGRELGSDQARRPAAGRRPAGERGGDAGVIPLTDARGRDARDIDARDIDASPRAQGPGGAVCLLAA